MRSLRTPAFVPEAVLGWRAWSVIETDDGPRLSSLTRAQGWTPGEELRAACDRRQHDSPKRWCSCGVYAGADPADLAALGRIAGGVVGQVSLWGRIVEHSRGHRASVAYPARLRLVCATCLSEGRGVPATRVDQEDAGGRTRLIPLCDEHAATEHLPDAVMVERRLLDAYQVERLPDDALRRIERRTSSTSSPRIASLAAVFALLALALAFALSGRQEVRRAAAFSSPVSVVRDTSGAYLPYQRSNDGAVTPIASRYAYLSPFDELRCGRATPPSVVPTTCKDPATNVFVGQVERGAAGADACDPRTVTAVEHRRAVVCWWRMPDGAAGTGHTYLKY